MIGIGRNAYKIMTAMSGSGILRQGEIVLDGYMHPKFTGILRDAMDIKAGKNLISGDFGGVITEKGEEAAFFTAGVRFSGFHDLGILRAKAR